MSAIRRPPFAIPRPGLLGHLSRRGRALFGLSALALVAGLMASSATGGAAGTDRDSIDGNRFATDPTAEEPYGMHAARLAPFAGDSFIDRAKGAVTFQFYAGSAAPTPVPSVSVGQEIRLALELPATLQLSTASGWCNPDESGTPRLYLSASCSTTTHPNGKTRVNVVLTAKRNLTGAHWASLRQNSIAVSARDGQVVGADAALVSMSFPDDEGHFRKTTRELPFTTAVGVATDLNVKNVRFTSPIGAGSTPLYLTHDEGYLSFETDLADPDNRGVSLKTGESFTYTVRIPNNPDGGRGSLVYDPDRPPNSAMPDACKREVDGYDIRCTVAGSVIKLITTRIGPDVVNDRPVADQIFMPIVSTFTSTNSSTSVVTAQVELSVVAEQWGSRPDLGVAEVLVRGYSRNGLGVRGLAVTPYVGSSFAAGGLGRLTFDFLPDDYPGTPAPSINAGDEVTVKVNLGTRFTVDTSESGPEQGDSMRNWCDQLDGWGPDLQGYLGAPDCTAYSDDDTGEVIVTVTVLALQTVEDDRLDGGFQIRVRAGTVLEDGVAQVTAEITSSRPSAVVNAFRRGVVDVPTIDNETSSLGVWGAQARTVSGAPGTRPEGTVTWFTDSRNIATIPEFYPFTIETGDTLTYRVELPEGLEYTATPTPGTVDDCALPNRHLAFTGSCLIEGNTIDYTLTWTGPGAEWEAFDLRFPLTIPVVHTTPDEPITGDVEILFSASIVQSGSDQRRAVVPVQVPSPNGYGIHNPVLAPYVGDAFGDQSEGAIAFDFFGGDGNPGQTPEVKPGEQIVITADLPASLEFTEQDSKNYAWCDPDGQLVYQMRTYAAAVCEVTNHPDGSSSLRLTMTATSMGIPTDPRFWRADYWNNTIGVIARDGQVDGTGTARMTIAFPDDARHDRTRVAEATFTTRSAPDPSGP